MKLPSYPELSTIAALYPTPNILLGEQIAWTEKRDGSNLRLAVVEDKLAIATRHQEVASQEFQDKFTATGDAAKVEALIRENLAEYGSNLVVFGEILLKGKSPARFEHHEKDEFVVFDMWDARVERIKDGQTDGFLPYTLMYQHCYHYGLAVVERWGLSRHTTMESLFATRDDMLAMAKEKGREGIVLKCPSVAYAKEKLDLPKTAYVKLDEGSVHAPPLPESEVMGAVAKAHADLGVDFRDKTKAMPLIAKYVSEECEKHHCSKPTVKLFSAYTTYLEGIADGKATEDAPIS